ncbi:MAG: TetR/AcrR family transcriptional regulator [Eubacteriaceae bacterium]|nr:TetR/AcrR family transcriptional regulator [Eubacteriaceae bacterium]
MPFNITGGSSVTRENILLSAKQEFYAKGYNDATLKSIAESAQVQSSLILYYHKSKDSLVGFVLYEFYKNIEALVDSQADFNIESYLIKKMVLSYIYFDIIFSDKNNKRFFFETCSKKRCKSNFAFNLEFSNRVIVGLAEEFKLLITDQELVVYTQMRSGAWSAFFHYYFENQDSLDMRIFDIVAYTEAIAPSLLGIDRRVIDNSLLRCRQFVKMIDYSAVKFLQ